MHLCPIKRLALILTFSCFLGTIGAITLDCMSSLEEQVWETGGIYEFNCSVPTILRLASSLVLPDNVTLNGLENVTLACGSYTVSLQGSLKLIDMDLFCAVSLPVGCTLLLERVNMYSNNAPIVDIIGGTLSTLRSSMYTTSTFSPNALVTMSNGTLNCTLSTIFGALQGIINTEGEINLVFCTVPVPIFGSYTALYSIVDDDNMPAEMITSGFNVPYSQGVLSRCGSSSTRLQVCPLTDKSPAINAVDTVTNYTIDELGNVRDANGCADAGALESSFLIFLAFEFPESTYFTGTSTSLIVDLNHYTYPIQLGVQVFNGTAQQGVDFIVSGSDPLSVSTFSITLSFPDDCNYSQENRSFTIQVGNARTLNATATITVVDSATCPAASYLQNCSCVCDLGYIPQSFSVNSGGTCLKENLTSTTGGSTTGSNGECMVECSENATCRNGTCYCNNGFAGDGAICIDINECLYNNGNCDYHTSCTNTPGSRVCGDCPLGFVVGNGNTTCEALCGDGECDRNVGENCVSCPSDCTSTPCDQCGDLYCGMNETCATCTADCGLCTPLVCPGEPICTGHGICNNGICACGGTWDGPACNTNTIPIEQANATYTEPGIEISPIDNITFGLTLLAIREMDAFSNVVTEVTLSQLNFSYDFGQCSNCSIAKYVVASPSINNKQWLATIALGNTAYLDLMVIQFYDELSNVSFANTTEVYGANTIKLAVQVRGWPFHTVQNSLAIVFNSPHTVPQECYDVVSQKDENDNLKWLSLNINGVTLYLF